MHDRAEVVLNAICHHLLRTLLRKLTEEDRFDVFRLDDDVVVAVISRLLVEVAQCMS